MKNIEKIKQMSEDEIAPILMCPYGSCIKDKGKKKLVSVNECNDCMKAWLNKEVE